VSTYFLVDPAVKSCLLDSSSIQPRHEEGTQKASCAIITEHAAQHASSSGSMSQDDDGNQSGEVILSPSSSDSSTCRSNDDNSDAYSSVSMDEDRPLVNEDRGIMV
jgi:hypothetical protein